MMNRYPRLLVISHNLLDKNNNVGKTLQSLLTNWPKECLSSLYFRNEQPKKFFCDNYYLLHDKDVLKSILTFGRHQCGIPFSEKQSNIKQATSTEKSLYRIGNKRKSIVSFVRDALWSTAVWDNTKLKTWIEDVRPEIILFVPNDYCLAFDVLMHVKKYSSAPVITYYMDDPFYYNQKISGIDKIRRKQLRKYGGKIAKNSEKLFTTCRLMSEEYKQIFNLDCVEFGNCVELISNEMFIDSKRNLTISYIGNLHSNRWKSIIELADVIDDIIKKEDESLKITFQVYSASDMEQTILDLFKKRKCLTFNGAISPKEVKKVQLKSDILVHVEAFDDKSKISTRLSVSTKIFEYLAAGKPVIAYGPKDIASMQYLSNTGASMIADSHTELYDCIIELISSSQKRQEMGEKGRLFAQKYCSVDIESIRFESQIVDVIKKVSNEDEGRY